MWGFKRYRREILNCIPALPFHVSQGTKDHIPLKSLNSASHLSDFFVGFLEALVCSTLHKVISIASHYITMTTKGYAKVNSTLFVVLGYGLCSSLLAVINKYAITDFPFPGFLTALQYASSVGGVVIAGKLGWVYHDPLMWDIVKKFLPAAVVFYLAIFTNTNLLKHANVDTFIVFRSSTPIIVAAADTIFRKQPCPSMYTFGSLFVILAGAVGYVITDSTFTVQAYSWAVAYLVVITTEMVYIKHMVTNLGLNTWGFVYYNNLLSLLIAPLFFLLTGEYADFFQNSAAKFAHPSAAISVGLSCLFGLAISFFGFAARRAISATAFTVTGVVNKLLTVVINVLIWDKHATSIGLICLLLTIAGGVLYQQSTTSFKTVVSSTKSDGEKQSDIEKAFSSEPDNNQEGVPSIKPARLLV